MNPFKRKPKPPSINPAELVRLQAIEKLTSRLIKLLDKGEVDYDLAAELKALLNG